MHNAPCMFPSYTAAVLGFSRVGSWRGIPASLVCAGHSQRVDQLILGALGRWEELLSSGIQSISHVQEPHYYERLWGSKGQSPSALLSAIFAQMVLGASDHWKT